MIKVSGESANSPNDYSSSKSLFKERSSNNLLQMVESQDNLHMQIESLLGVPPPFDGEVSFTSLNSSISMPDSDIQDQLSVIRNKNKELQKTATLTIQDFKNTSRNLLSRSQLPSNKNSLILNDLECGKKNLENTDEEVKNQSCVNFASLEVDDSMGVVYLKIQDIQKEINDAAQRLLESEKMIMCTESKNQILESRIKELEKSLNCLDIIEGPDKGRAEICTCVIS